MTDQNPHRLPRQVLPKHYVISLEPDLESSSFEGTVSIELDVVSETDTVILNAAELEIEGVSIEQNETIQANSIVLNEELERAEFGFPRRSSSWAGATYLLFQRHFERQTTRLLSVYLEGRKRERAGNCHNSI